VQLRWQSLQVEAVENLLPKHDPGLRPFWPRTTFPALRRSTRAVRELAAPGMGQRALEGAIAPGLEARDEESRPGLDGCVRAVQHRDPVIPLLSPRLGQSKLAVRWEFLPRRPRLVPCIAMARRRGDARQCWVTDPTHARATPPGRRARALHRPKSQRCVPRRRPGLRPPSPGRPDGPWPRPVSRDSTHAGRVA